MDSKTQTLQVLIASNKNSIADFLPQMNIQTDVVVALQNGEFGCTNISLDENTNNSELLLIETNTKGVGINRNIALSFSTSDICLLSDDDLCYVDGYSDVILDAFHDVKNADVLIFNVKTIGSDIERRVNEHIKRVNIFNFMNYGAVRIAFRRKAIENNNIQFTNLFGGGGRYCAGEDVTFLKDCLDSKLKVFTYPSTIAIVDQNSSSWFTGFNEKYFYDKGVLLDFNFSGPIRYLFALYFAMKFYRKSKMSLWKVYKIILSGFKEL